MPVYPQVTVNENDPQVQAAVAAYEAMKSDGVIGRRVSDPRYAAYQQASENIKDQVEVIMMRKERAAKGMGGRRRKTRARKSRRHGRKTRRYRK
jgi:hypothetical protein